VPEHVLAVAGAVLEPAEDLDDLLVEVAAVGLEDGLLPGLHDEVVELGLRLVVHLLDPSRLDPAVLDQLLQRQPRDLAAETVERREDDRLRRVVDDEVDARQVLERPDVPALAADDPALHVVRGQVHDRHGRFRRVACGYALKRVRHEVPGAALRLDLRLLLGLAHAPGKLVPDELLRLLQHNGLRLAEREPRDALELLHLLVLCLLQLLLEGFRVHLPIGQALLPSCEFDHAAIDLGLLAADPLLGGGGRGPALLDVGLDLGTELDRFFPSLDLRLAAHGVCLAARLGEEQLAIPPRGRQPVAAEPEDGQRDDAASDEQPDRDSDADGHVRAPETLCGCRGVAAGPSHTRPEPDIDESVASGARGLRNAAPLRSLGFRPESLLAGHRRIDFVVVKKQNRFENAQMQAKWWMRLYVSYRSLEALPNEPLQRVGREPAPGEEPKCSVGRPLELEHAPGPLRLRFELSEGLVGGVVGESLLGEPPPDRIVAVAALSERLRPRGGGSAVVDEPCALERIDRPAPLGRCDAPSRESRFEPGRAQVTVAQCSCGRVDCLDAAKLGAKPSKKGPVELEPSAKSAADYHLRRQAPPGRTVEVDLDLPGAGLPKSGDSGYAETSSASSGTGSGNAAPCSTAALGSRRAETTWSGPASAWRRCRICCVTSGCSRRKADAFWRPCPSRSSSKLK
jgi:hypothetical protein